MKTLRKIWNTVSELGLVKTNPDLNNQSIIYCNKIALIAALIVLLNIIVFSFLNFYFYAFIYFLFFLLILPVFLLNYHFFHLAASFYLVLYSNIGTFLLCSITGKEAGNYIYFIDVLLLNFFIFSYEHKRFILYNFFITGLLMIILDITNYSLLLDSKLTIFDQSKIFQISLLSTAIFMFFCIYSIIKIRNKMEIAFNEEEDTLKLILNHSPLGIVILDESRKIISYNINFKNIFIKFGIYEIKIGRELTEYIPDQEKGNLYHYLNLVEQGNIIQIEKNFKTEYTSHWFDLTVSSIKTENINNRIVITLLDITDRKELEIESQIAREKAIAVNHSKSHFLSTISNQIRKVMNDINISLQNLSERNPRTDQILILDKLNKSSLTLNRLIDGILDYTAIESGNLQIGNSKLDLKSELLSIRDLFIDRVQEKGIDFIFIVDEDIPKYVMAEPAWIRQILSHLLRNSLHFTEKGKIIFNASILKNSETKVTIRFSISDTGRGISKKTLRQLVQNFREPETQYIKNRPSFRLGFTVIKRLLALFDSHIYIESELGKGSNIYFSIEFIKMNHSGIEILGGW